MSKRTLSLFKQSGIERERETEEQRRISQNIRDFKAGQEAIARRHYILHNGTAFAITAHQYSTRVEFNKINPKYN